MTLHLPQQRIITLTPELIQEGSAEMARIDMLTHRLQFVYVSATLPATGNTPNSQVLDHGYTQEELTEKITLTLCMFALTIRKPI